MWEGRSAETSATQSAPLRRHVRSLCVCCSVWILCIYLYIYPYYRPSSLGRCVLRCPLARYLCVLFFSKSCARHMRTAPRYTLCDSTTTTYPHIPQFEAYVAAMGMGHETNQWRSRRGPLMYLLHFRRMGISVAGSPGPDAGRVWVVSRARLPSPPTSIIIPFLKPVPTPAVSGCVEVRLRCLDPMQPCKSPTHKVSPLRVPHRYPHQLHHAVSSSAR